MRCPVCERNWPLERSGFPEMVGRIPGHFSQATWACPECIGNGRALAGHPERQNYGGLGSPPFLAYWDREQSCRYCSRRFVFTAEEQRHLYEEVGAHVQAYQPGCPACRRTRGRAKKARQELMRLTPLLDPEDPDQLVRLAELSVQAGSHKRALDYFRRAKNKARSEEQRQALLARLAGLEGDQGPKQPPGHPQT